MPDFFNRKGLLFAPYVISNATSIIEFEPEVLILVLW